MSDLMAAAQSLITRLKLPAQFHSVWIRTETDEETHEFKKSLCVSIRPGHEHKVQVPTEHMGIPVVSVPWPEAS